MSITSLVCRRGVMAAACAAAFAACSSSAPEPETAISCSGNEVSITITNVSETTARYTVSFELQSDGGIEQEMISTNDVGPGETTTVTEPTVFEVDDCRITGTRVFEQ